MDMQNVAKLDIPEGEVRTVYDKDGNLIWGKVSYGVKYKGETSQQTYTGKNLMPYPYDGGGNGNGITFTANSDGSVTLNGKNNNSGNSSYRLQANITFQAGTYYFIVPSNTDVMFSAYDGSRYYDIQSSNNYTLTLSAATTLQYIIIQVARGGTSQFDNYVVYPMLTTISGQTVADYEPYVGGVPAPNPDYPQAVQTVTGENVVKISDGQGNEQSYTIDLGSIELCKIGTYQDYIYKSGGKWYVRKETTRLILDENSGFALYTGLSDTGFAFFRATVPTPKNRQLLCTYFDTSFEGWDNLRDQHIEMAQVYTNNALYLKVLTTRAATLAELNTWLASSLPKIYFALAIPTDTEITNTTLVAQLEAAEQWLTRYGYNATVSGNLPIIIDRTAL